MADEPRWWPLQGLDANHRYQLHLIALRGVIVVAVVLASCAPLLVVWLCVRDLAGKRTVASFGFTATITLAGVAAVVDAFWQRRKNRLSRDEIATLKQQRAHAEGRLSALKSETK